MNNEPYWKLTEIVGHVCRYCLRPADKADPSPDNVYKTDWCISCGQLGEGLRIKGERLR